MAIVVDHPLVQHKLTLLRDKETSTKSFRSLIEEIGVLLAYEVTRDLPVQDVTVDTPFGVAAGKLIAGRDLALISILRAGNGLVDGFLKVLPSARVGHIGLYRDRKTHVPVEYYLKLPTGMAERQALVLAPILGTGNSAAAAVERVKEAGAERIRFVCIVAARTGLANFEEQHPDVPFYTAAVDPELDKNGFIVPGLGDAGDRMYGTR